MGRFVGAGMLALLAWVIFAAGCGPATPTSTGTGTTTAEGSLTELKIALVPSEDNEQMLASFEPIRTQLEKSLGIPVRVIAVTDYGGVIEAMRGKRLDLAWYGPMSYVIAEREADAEVFAVAENPEGKTTYRSCWLVPADSTAQRIQDLKGKRAAFVDPASTSGGLVPSFMVLRDTGEPAERFFARLTYSGTHDAAILAVKNKNVDVAGVNEVTLISMKEKGLVNDSQVRVLQYSDPIPGSPLAWRNDLPQEIKDKVKAEILKVHETVPEMNVLSIGEIKRFVEATPAEYQPIRDLVDQLKIDRARALK